MEKDGKQSKLMLLESTKHAMNLGLRIKEKDGKKSYVVKFFDPNQTTTGTRSKANSAKTFETQTLESYVNADDLKDYYPEPVGMSIICVRPKEHAQTGSSTVHGSSISRALTSMDIEDIDVTVMWYLITKGFAGNLRQLRDHFTALPEDKRIELLATKDGDGTPALLLSMNDGDAEMVKAYGELVRCVPPEKQVDLLLAKASEGPLKGFSGLDMALEENQFSAAKEQLRLLNELAPSLSKDKRAKLRNELKESERHVLNAATHSPSPTELMELSQMKGMFSKLKAALVK